MARKSRKKPRQAATPIRSGSMVETGAHRRHNLWAGMLAIVVLTLVAYIPAMQGGFIWDDDSYVTENSALRTPKGLVQIWLEPAATPQYYPLVFSSFWIEHQLWDDDPTGYHVTNVLLHAAAAVLLWVALRQLALPGAWLAAAVFALHPVHVESVAWITERKNVLSGLCYIGAVLCLLKFFGIGAKSVPSSRPRLWYVLALLLFAGALLSKTVTATLPAAMVLILWWQRGTLKGKDIGALIPFFALGLAFGLITVWLERHHVGALGYEWDLSAVERLLIAGRALWFYAGKLLWPAELMFNYPRWQIDAGAAWQYLFPLGALLVIIGLWVFRRRLGRGALAAVLFFCGTLFPALGFFNVFPFRYSFVADHFQYLASIGLIVLIIGAAGRATARLSPAARRAAAALGLMLLVPLGIQTWQLGHDYKDLPTLWAATLDKNPDSALAHHNQGLLLAEEGDISAAVQHFRKALELEPRAAEIHDILGVALVKQGNIEEAERHFTEAVNLRPDYAKAHYHLALVLAMQQRPATAIDHLKKALQLRPNDAEAHFELGRLLGDQGRLREAALHFSETLRIEPNHKDAQKYLEMSIRMMQQ